MSDTTRPADLDETATFLKVQKTWLYNLTRKDAIPHFKLGKYLRFNLPEVLAWAQRGCPANWRETPTQAK